MLCIFHRRNFCKSVLIRDFTKMVQNGDIDEYVFHDDVFHNLLEFSELNDSSGLKELINNSPSVINLINNGDNHGFTPLMLAASHASLDCLKILIQNGSDVVKSGNGGITFLRHRICCKYYIIIDISNI